MDPATKLASVLADRDDDYRDAFRHAFQSDAVEPADEYARGLIEFLAERWKFDFASYELDKVDGDSERGRLFLRLMLAAYADEIEDVQEEVGQRLRRTIALLKRFAPKLDYLNEVVRDSFVRRPLNRLWQMEPIAIFEDMSVSEDAEFDSLLDSFEKNFTPVLPDVAGTADRIRRQWFKWFTPKDERDEMIFYEIMERAVTHVVATESRVAATDWILRNLDGNGLIVGILDICSRGLECLTMFCGNYKFVSEHRPFVESLLEGRG